MPKKPAKNPYIHFPVLVCAALTGSVAINTIPNINVIGCYLDVESRQDTAKTERVWTKVIVMCEVALGRGEGVIIMGYLNRALQATKPSFGTKLLKDWEESGQVIIMNDKDTHTRFNPCTDKGSALNVGVISRNIKEALVKFSVDTEREWSPFTLRKLPSGE